MPDDIRYCTTSDGVRIAWTSAGSGERTLVYGSNFCLASLGWQLPGRASPDDVLGAMFTVVRYDSRGTGMSQRDVEDVSLEGIVRDIEAVVDASGGGPVVLFGNLGGVLPAATYAAGHPEAVSHLVLWPPPPVAHPESVQSRTLGQIAGEDWETFTEMFASIGVGWERGDESRAYARYMRETMSQRTFLRSWGPIYRARSAEAYARAADVRVPTLVLQREGFAEFAFYASPIPGARIRALPGKATSPLQELPQAFADAVAEFAGAIRPSRPAEPAPPPGAPAAMAVILFTDIADSTPLTERLGDAAFRDASRALEMGMRAAMRDAGGTPVDGKVLGDGVMAVFASAAQAIDAARRCVALSAESELRLHIGLHAGDVIREGGNVYGGAVNIASRICGLCEPGEILVTQTVRDLARTSAGVSFEDRGEHALKGVGDPVRVFAVG